MEIFLISVTLITLFIASYTDLKTREVPDWLNYAFLFTAFGIRIIFAFQNGLNIFLSGFFGFLAGFLLACLFYYAGQWGGGDSKLLMGMGASIGILFPFSYSSLTLGWFFLLLLITGAVYGLGWMIIIAIRSRARFLVAFKQYFSEHQLLHHFLICLSLLIATASIAYPFLWPLAFFLPLIFYLFLFMNSIEQINFIKTIPISKLTEGDWLTKPVEINGKAIISSKTIEKRDLQLLQQLSHQKKITTVIIKEGIPFIPCFLISYIFLLLSNYYLPALKYIF